MYLINFSTFYLNLPRGTSCFKQQQINKTTTTITTTKKVDNLRLLLLALCENKNKTKAKNKTFHRRAFLYVTSIQKE